jgi:N-acetylglucosaminyldiphosphoundecaprenol N-acetyl-beta-D-mannosaminyltransferase
LVVARSDRPFRLALQSASAVVADGVGCRIGAALAGVPIGPRITGSDFYLALMSALQASGGGRVFFFGSSASVLTSIRERTSADFPGVTVDALAPPFGEWDAAQNAEFIERINAAAPDVLWIGMTAPKQEKWMAANAAALRVPVVGCVGAVFEYYAGTVRRAPEWLCDLGLEWLYRLAGEPQRLWRRTLVSAPVFLWAALSQRLAGPPGPARESASP